MGSSGKEAQRVVPEGPDSPTVTGTLNLEATHPPGSKFVDFPQRFPVRPAGRTGKRFFTIPSTPA